MAIEKMKIVSIAGKLPDLDRITRFLVINGSMHVLNALSELSSNSPGVSVSQEHMKELQELAHLKPYVARRDFTKDEAMLKFFWDMFKLEPEICQECLNIDYDYESETAELRKIYESLSGISEALKEKAAVIEKLQRQLENVAYLRSISSKVQELKHMSFIKFRLLMLSNENFRRLELNLENIPSVVIRVAAEDGNVVVGTFTPAGLLEEAERVFTSLNYKELELPEAYSGNAAEVAKQLQGEIDKEKRFLEELRESIMELKERYGAEVIRAYTLLELLKKAERIKQDAALGHSMFFIFGFIPDSEMDTISKELQRDFGDSIVLAADNVDARRYGHAPPTRIRNNVLVRPFEALISMYGTPSYGEKDPTPFFAISYMLLFGAMFGDLGQGLVILLGGLFIGYKTKNKSFGGILARLGLSSMVFGALYGSIFGSEELIEPLLIRPMANINTMLMGAIVLGMLLITVSYIFSLVNHYSSKNVEEGLFGREGLAGFIFFLTLVYAVAGKVTGRITGGLGIPIGVMVAMLLVMVFKQPLAGLLTGHRLYEDSAGDYYIEAGFGVVETILSVASNIISFIRVGAFALNHVGLYIAFATMAEMMHSKIGGVIVLVIGNIIIIGLEGLIVFIQSLRLEYYELFSKYYSGYGIEYDPVSLSDKENSSDML